MLELFVYDYLQRALLAGMLVALTAPLIGVFMVLKRLSLIGDTLSHTAFAGVALGTFLQVSPIWSALVVTVLSSLGIAKLRQSAKISGDATLAVFFSTGLALGIVIISISPRFTINLTSLLFGSLLLVSWADVWLVAGIGFVTTIIVTLLFKELVHTTLDEDLARASGLPVNQLNYILSILIGVIIVATMRIVGILLVSALLIIPPLSSMQVAKSFKLTVILSMVFALAAVVVGMLFALTFDAPPGGTIVLTAIITFFATLTLRKVADLRRGL